MLEKMRETRLGRWTLTGAVAAAFVAPATAGTAAAAENEQRSPDRYERVQTANASGAKAQAARYRKQGRAAADLVNRVARRLEARGYDIQCRTWTTQLGGLGVIECKGSLRAKRELSRQIRRLVREGKIIAPEASGHYFDGWSANSNRVVRIDWARFGHIGIPA
jgi:hypothetical protein